MKRFRKLLIVFGSLLFVLVLGIVGLYCTTFAGLAPSTDADLAANVHVIRMSHVSAFLVDIGPKQVALIDAGVEPDGKAILAALQSRGMGPDAVRAIFITHGHGDHIAAVKLFPSAEVFALESERALIAGEIGSASLVGRLQRPSPTGIRLTRGLSDGDSVHVGEVGVRVFAVPGHTRGSAAYVVGETLFLGDAANLTTGGRVVGPMRPFSDDAAQGRESLRQLGKRLDGEKVKVQAMGFAHSGPLMGNGAAALQAVQ